MLLALSISACVDPAAVVCVRRGRVNRSQQKVLAPLRLEHCLHRARVSFHGSRGYLMLSVIQEESRLENGVLSSQGLPRRMLN